MPQVFAQVATPEVLLYSGPLRDAPVREILDDRKGQLEKEEAPQLLEPLPPTQDLRVDIRQFDIQGVDPEVVQRLLPKLQSFIGPGKTYEDLSHAVTVVTRYMQSEEGLYLAYAYLPSQRMLDGVIRIQVLPGKLQEVELVWSEGLPVQRSVVDSHLSQLQPESVLRVDEVERVLFLLNDLKGIRFTVKVKPGTKAGYAVLVVQPSLDQVVTGRVTLDNHGSKAIGRERIGVAATLNSPFGRGDSLSASHLRSFGGELEFSLLNYSSPVGNSGLRLGASVSNLDYELNEPVQTNGQDRLEGDSQTFNLYGLYPWIRSRNLNVFGLLSLEHGRYSDQFQGGQSNVEKDVDSIEAFVSGDSRDDWMGGGITAFEVSWRYSQVEYDNGRPLGLDDEPRTSAFKYNFSRLQSLIPGRVLGWVSIRGQEAENNLDSTNQCALGGARNVRAFAQGAAPGDSCMIMTAEARYIVPRDWLPSGIKSLSVNLFYDRGTVRFREDADFRFAQIGNENDLSGYGVSLNMDLGKAFADFSNQAAGNEPSPLSVELVWSKPSLHGVFAEQTETRRLFGALRYHF
ncbi:MAG: ShlB/FhaC/HecB family hemolysin secretion/activation protein [Limnobacter sp.]|nr:ShlB/FhaC/HecB family hemolysin secretion/activation protein [Limnobacter sp.]